MDDYLPILVLIILGFLFAAFSFVGSAMLAPKKRPTAAKIAPYECGIVPTIEPPIRFPVRFYLVAMIFIIFDIEIVFLYPLAVIFRQLRSFGLIEVLVFAAVVFISFLFLVSNGALTWGPAKRWCGPCRPAPRNRPSPASPPARGDPAGTATHRAPTAPRPPTPSPRPPAIRPLQPDPSGPRRGKDPSSWDLKTSSTISSPVVSRIW